MTANKATVEKYMEAFSRLDHEMILSCLTDDVEWEAPGHYHHFGKEAFDREIENDAFTGRPAISVSRVTEEDDVVIAEGSVKCSLKDGTMLNIRFCDVFEMHEAKIKKLVSYLAVMP